MKPGTRSWWSRYQGPLLLIGLWGGLSGCGSVGGTSGRVNPPPAGSAGAGPVEGVPSSRPAASSGEGARTGDTSPGPLVAAPAVSPPPPPPPPPPSAGVPGPTAPPPGPPRRPATRSPELERRLAEALAAKGPGYVPRTELKSPEGRPRFTNRLILEDSPYLVQHAHNAVDWFPWGPEAFEKARSEGKPIFLSIGYSTCHWCHVMERESFDDVEIARVMNENFVSIKVDREQRPDVDEVYMTAVMLLTRGGGWPMSSFLTPEGKPFFGGTYYPPQSFRRLLEQVAAAWRDRRTEIEAQAGQVARAVSEITGARAGARTLDASVHGQAVSLILARHDAKLGGFSGAPKFPHESEILYLLDHAQRTGAPSAMSAALVNLDAMARGGIHDQVGGGFHRYSTDANWLVPHFEKMLYNQAHLARAYALAHRLTGDPLGARVARQILDYVLRDMTGPEGGFYSATDADSEDEEGLFFVWTAEELGRVLAPGEEALAIALYGVTGGGNFEGRNILHLSRPLDETARDRGLSLDQLLEQVDRIRERLYRVREKRIHPIRDEKVLTAWNGMMITSLAEVSGVLGEPKYLEAAKKAAGFLWNRAHRGDGRLWRILFEGRASIPGGHEDSAYLLEALLELADATGEPVWLERARLVASAMIDQFWDAEHGGFFMTAPGADPHLFALAKSPNDGAIPSANSVAVTALARLARRTGDLELQKKAEATLSAFAGAVAQQPAGYTYMLRGARILNEGEAGPRDTGAGGRIRLAATATPATTGAMEVHVDLEIASGWHINSDQPLQEELIPTSLALGAGREGWTMGPVRFPPAHEMKVAFIDQPVRIHEGRIRISTTVSTSPAAPPGPRVLPLAVTFQPCSQEVCLAPETVTLEVSIVPAGRVPGPRK